MALKRGKFGPGLPRWQCDARRRMQALAQAGPPRGSLRRRDSAPGRTGDGLGSGLGRRASWGHVPAAASREAETDGADVEPGSPRRRSADVAAAGRGSGSTVWRNALWNKNVVTRTRGVQLGVTTQVRWLCLGGCHLRGVCGRVELEGPRAMSAVPKRTALRACALPAAPTLGPH